MLAIPHSNGRGERGGGEGEERRRGEERRKRGGGIETTQRTASSRMVQMVGGCSVGTWFCRGISIITGN